VATYYWFGTGTWDNSNTANWWTGTGGTGSNPGSAPTTADDLIINAASGAGTITIGTGAVGLTLNMTGFTGTLAFGSNTISLAGNAATVFTGATVGTLTGTPRIDLTYSGSTGQRTIVCGAVTEARSISFYVTAGSDTFALTGNLYTLDFTGFSGSWAIGGTGATSVRGSIVLSSGMTVTSGTRPYTFNGSGGQTQQIAPNGVTCGMNVTVSVTGGGTVELLGALSITTSRTLTVTSGIFKTNGYTLTCLSFSGSGATARDIQLGASTITVAASTTTAWNMGTTTNLTWDAGTSSVLMTGATAKTFVGGGLTYGTLSQGGAGALTISGANTFADIQNPYKTTGATELRFTHSVTQTVLAFTAAGEAGRVLTIDSTSAGSAATLSKASGAVVTDYLSLKDSTATGGAIFYAGANSTDVSGNTGWLFTGPPGGAGNFFMFFG
jgi:hypothetical protein